MKECSVDHAIVEWMERALKGQPLDKQEFLLAHRSAAPGLVQALDELAGGCLPQGGDDLAEDGERDEFASLVDALDRLKQSPPPLPRKAVPNHEILSWIGGGAFGHVWLARHTLIGQRRAIKIISLRGRTPVQVERVLAEARIMASLGKHRNRVAIYDAFVDGGDLVLILEYVSGGPLSLRTSPDAPMPWESACRYGGQVAEGLLELHGSGILHRDVKPANIFLDEASDQALLGDFGLAVGIEGAHGTSGTAGYAAPELLSGRSTAKSDVFSLAATLFHLVVGHSPFDCQDLLVSLVQASTGLVPPVPALAPLPKAVEKLILAGLEPDPETRIGLTDFAEQLRVVHLAIVADRLTRFPGQSLAPVDIAVSVWTKGPQDPDFRRAASKLPSAPLNGLAESQGSEDQAAYVQTGDLVRFDISVSADGYLTVLNLSSQGALDVVFPNPRAGDHQIRGGQPYRITVEIMPPDGTDRTVFIWTCRSEPLTSEQWRERIERIPDAVATRDVAFVLHESAFQPAADLKAHVVRIVHRAPARDQPPALRTGQGAGSAADTVVLRAMQSVEGGTWAGFDGLRSPGLSLACISVVPPSRIAGGIAEPLWLLVGPENRAHDVLQPDPQTTYQFPGSGRLALAVSPGETLSFRASVLGADVQPRMQDVVWNGQGEKLRFTINVQAGLKGPVVGKILIHRHGHPVPIARLRLELLVEGQIPDATQPAERSNAVEVRHFTRAYISSVSPDRRDVAKRLDFLRRSKIAYPLESLETDPAERWETGIHRQIDGCDLFLLFWSAAAASSPWLLEELRYALRHQARHPQSLPETVAVLLPEPKPLPLPPEVRSLLR